MKMREHAALSLLFQNVNQAIQNLIFLVCLDTMELAQAI
ncbi:Uncharacterised protein [Legionella pneumophila]|nr:Uncharacterised protein [Legionella pneumophila]